MTRTLTRTPAPTRTHGGAPWRRGAAALAGAALAMSALAACGDDSPAAAGKDQASAVTVEDPWVKAADSGGATAVFGVLSNDSDSAVTITGAGTEVAGTTQLHETTMSDDGGMEMQEMDGGLAVGPGEERALEPGGDHVMLMDLTTSLEPGAEVEVTLMFSDDSQTTFTAPVRSYTGAQEDYDGDGHDGHDHEHE